MNPFAKLTLAAACVATLAFSAHAASPHSDSHHGSIQTASAGSSAPTSAGEVRKVDKDAKKITIKHGDLKNLGMPPMTMVFRVKDAAMLDQVKPGDKIGFVADKVDGQLTVTKIEMKN